MKNSNFSKACSEISQSLLQIIEPTKKQAKLEIKKICTKYSLERIPKNHEILSTVDGKSCNCTNAKTICLSTWKMYL